MRAANGNARLLRAESRVSVNAMSDWRVACARRSARNKGREFELKIAGLLKALFPRVKRHLEFQQSEAMGFDLDNTGRYRIQCKRFKSYAPITCIEEVKSDGLGLDVPVLVTAADNKPIMAVIPFDEFVRLVRESRSY